MFKKYLNGGVIAIAILLSSCGSGTQSEKTEDAATEEKPTPVVVAKNQKLVAEFTEVYYLVDDVADGYRDGDYQLLVKVDRKSAVADTIYSLVDWDSCLDAVLSPDSSAIIIAEDASIGDFCAKRYDISTDSISEIIPNFEGELLINAAESKIICKSRVLTFYGGGEDGINNEYADVEDIYDLNGNLIQKGSAPTSKLTQGNYHFSGSAKLMGMSGNVDLAFAVDASGNITGSGYIWSRQRCELKGQVHGKRVEIKGYMAGRLKAKMDLTLKVTSRGNSLNGTMMDDDYTFTVTTTGYKQR